MDCVCLESLSGVRLFEAAWTVAHQAPLSMNFSRQEYRSGLPFPTPGGLLDPGIKPASPELAGEFFTTRASWEAPSYGLNSDKKNQQEPSGRTGNRS